MTVIFTRAAETEFTQAKDWYDQQAPGVGERFQAEVDRVVQRISAHPYQFPAVFLDVRRALLRGFPHYLVFSVRPNAVRVIACFHPSRDPVRWQRRVVI